MEKQNTDHPSMPLYDSIGTNYSQTRKSDRRIAAKLLNILRPYSLKTVADIGAGTGTYAQILAEYGYQVLAIEPSVTMRKQAQAHPSINWIGSYAEQITLLNQAADAAIIMLAFHHFQSPDLALQEVQRIVGNGPILMFTYDPDMISEFWLTHYFPSLIQDVQTAFPPIPILVQQIQSTLRRSVQVIPFSLPTDLTDEFAAVGWSRPELYLNPSIRQGISSFSKMTMDDIEYGLERLATDLETGKWDRHYGHLRQLENYDIGYCFIHIKATTTRIPDSAKELDQPPHH